MPVTGLRGRQVLDGDITRSDINTSTAGSALIARIIAGTNISITSTGADSGTGDVTISAVGGGTTLNGTGFVRMNGTEVSYITGTAAQFVKANGTLDSSVYLTSYTETDTLATVTGRGATTTTLSNFNGGINMTGATSSTGLNITSSSASGGGSVIRITKTAAANQAYITFDTDQLFFGTPSNNTTDADVGTKGSVNLRLQTNYTTRINIGPTGTIRLVPLTSNGFLKTSGGDGTLTVDTATYLTAESDTLATVTGRGATTSTAVTFSGGVTIGGQGTGTGIIGNAGFTSNYTGISLNGTLSTSSYNILSSPTETTLYINRPTGAAIRFREANGSDQMVIATGGAVTFSSTITASSLIRSGGTSSQFLKADGSVDSNTYITSASVGNGTLTLAVSGTGLSGSASFTANQSGNTTFTVTSNATSANTASAIVARDASGNFSAGAITSSALYGTSYSTLTSGAGTGTAVFDTITTSGNRLYRVVISGNPNGGGSGSYLDWVYGKLIIGGGFDGTNVVNYIEFVQESPMPRTLFGSGGGDLTVDVKFVQSGTEYDSIGIGGTYTIRFKISGYNSSYTGTSTTINLLQIG